MRTLLILCSSDYDSLRALNLLGNKRQLTVLKRDDRAGIECQTEWNYQAEFLTEEATIATLPPKINEADFDEIVLLIPRAGLADTLSPFLNKLPQEKLRYICGDRLYRNKEELSSPTPWVSAIECRKKRSERHQTIPLFGMIGTFNEEDIIYATVRHMYENGASKVYILDNQSTDRTREEAVEAGAEIHEVYSTSVYNELLRITKLNNAIDSISRSCSHNKIWWMLSDADEFIEAPQAESGLAAWLNGLDAEIRVCGADQINYFPTLNPAYQLRQHPRTLLTRGEIFDAKQFVQHCSSWHWKHPVFRWDREGAEIRARSGFHILSCDQALLEPNQRLRLHHFPFREREATFLRYQSLCSSGRNKKNDSVSVGGKSAIQKRFEELEHIYEQRWNKVYIQPGILKSDEQRGVHPEEIPYSGPIWH